MQRPLSWVLTAVVLLVGPFRQSYMIFCFSVLWLYYQCEFLANKVKRLITCPDDDYNDVSLPSATEGEGSISTRTTWTMLLYLTSAAEGCLGGETVFYPHDRKVRKEEIAVGLETGMLLLHKHGNDCLLVRIPKATSARLCIY